MARGPAITIGTFDGVHCGHRALICAARDFVGAGGRVIALAFHPHPLSVLKPEAEPTPLSTFSQRSRWLAEAGANEVVRLAPSQETLSLTPDAFIDRVCAQWRPSALIEGPDFRFGRDRTGSVADLRRLGPNAGFVAHVIDPVEVALTDHSIAPASSTMTRWLLQRGRVGDAAIMLGRHYEIESSVEQGAQRGRTLGFPTVNLAENGCLIPADGVYAGEAELPDGSTRVAAISVGTNPTFAASRRTCEAFLLDWPGWREEYGWPIRLRFTAWLRDQIAFTSVEALTAQLARDVDRVREIASPCTSPAIT